MRVLILNQTFHPDVAATAQHMWDLARHLEASGHDVTALTSISRYGTDQRHSLAEEHYGRIRVLRVGGTAFGKIGTAARMADFATFYAAAAWRISQLQPPDVILALTSPPMIGAVAALQKQLRPGGVRPAFVYHVMDVYPAAAIVAGVLKEGHPTTSLLHRVTARTLELADGIIALGRDMADLLRSSYPHATRGDRLHIITPWADGQHLYPMARHAIPMAREHRLADSFNIIYSGNLGVAHDVETLAGAIRQTRDTSGLRWVFIGGGKRFDSLRQTADVHAWPNTRFLPYQDHGVLNQSLNLADVHLVSQLPAFTGVVVPSKLFGIMAVGKPAIMVGPAEAECSRILADNDCGRVVRNGDADGLVRAALELRDNSPLRRQMGERARLAFERDHEQRVCCSRIEQLLQSAVEVNRRRIADRQS